MRNVHRHRLKTPGAVARGCRLRGACIALGTAVTATAVGDDHDPPWQGPSDLEQHHVELINRARAEPAAEGLRLAATDDPEVLLAYDWFGVNLPMMQDEFSQLPPRPPLAVNPLLTAAARGHSQDMLDNDFQGHTGSDGSSVASRVNQTGYTWSILAENVYAYALSVWHGHAAFQVDWGPGADGMQPGRGHRMAIHGDYREVGVGVIEGTNGNAGPEVVTQVFGRGQPDGAFITGVAYYDVNGNGQYDPGEGIGGLTVTVDGVGQPFATWGSGGYTVPVPLADATRQIQFSGPDLEHSATAELEGGHNVKVDLALPYQPPVVDGPATPLLGTATSYGFSPVGGATGYGWRTSRELAAVNDDAGNLERGVSGSGGGYSRLSTDVKFYGDSSYRFAHPTPLPDETFTYHLEFLPGPEAVLRFRSRLGWASVNQQARVVVSTDDGATWTPVYQQVGTDDSGESTFVLRTVALGEFAGQRLLIRFSYLRSSGSVFPQTSAGVGWYVDAIEFDDISELHPLDEGPVQDGQSFAFTPFEPGVYQLAVRPDISDRPWAYGPGLQVIASEWAQGISYLDWAADEEAAAGLAPGTLADHPAGDFSGDGIANLLAYAMGLSPIGTEHHALPVWLIDGADLVFDYQAEAMAGEAAVVVQTSTDMQVWLDATSPSSPVIVTLVSTDGTLRRYRVRVPQGAIAPGRLFVRLMARAT